MPDGSRAMLGKDRQEALNTAAILEQRYGKRREDARRARLLKASQDPMGDSNPPFFVVADAYLAAKRPGLSAFTARNRAREIGILKKWFGDMPIRHIETYDVTRRLDTLTPSNYHALRNAAKQVWKYAINRGKAKYNIIEPIETKAQAFTTDQTKRVRKRHTWEGFKQSLQGADDWLQHASLIALFSLQRRSDLCALKWSQVNIYERTFEVKQMKTGVWISIRMGDELYRAVRWFFDVDWGERAKKPTARTVWQPADPCPYVIHRRPKVRTQRLRDAIDDGRIEHWYQVVPEQFTKAFQAARDSAEAYDHLPAVERPSLHDVRALGIFMLHKAGYPIEYIQALAGHAGEDMTLHYMAGHEKATPLEVEAGLSLEKVDLSGVNWETDIRLSLPSSLQEIIDQDDHDVAKQNGNI